MALPLLKMSAAAILGAKLIYVMQAASIYRSFVRAVAPVSAASKQNAQSMARAAATGGIVGRYGLVGAGRSEDAGVGQRESTRT